MVVLIDGRLVKELRVKRSYSQEKLAEIAGVNPRTIQRIEANGVTSLSTRGALAQALGVRPEDLDVPEASAVLGAQREPLGSWPRWLHLALSAGLVFVGGVVLAVSIKSATPIGLLTRPAVAGMLVALSGLFILSRLTPLRRWRIYTVLCVMAVALLASPPAWTIRALVAISLWAAFELGIVLTRFRQWQHHA